MTDETLMEDACVELARAQLSEGRGQEACATCELVLKKNPQHCGATVAYAEVARVPQEGRRALSDSESGRHGAGEQRCKARRGISDCR